MVSRFACALIVATALSINVWTQPVSSSGTAPIYLPLTTTETAEQTYKATVQVGIGSLPPMSIGFDTGSVGLELFAVPGIPGNGTVCSTETISVSYGNPLRVTYGGVLCYAAITLAGVISTPRIPFGLLTSMTFCAPGYQCNTPQENYADGIYGVFGAGISPSAVDLPNPLRTLPGAYGKRFMLRLKANSGEHSSLILAPRWHYDAAIFPQFEQSVGALNLPVYAKGKGCILVNGRETGVCALVSFDTGNGVPWVHVTVPNLPTIMGSNGGRYVAPGTTIGLAPRRGGTSPVSLVASTSFAGEFRYTNRSSDLINVSIQAFLGNDVTYDGEQGVITVAPTPTEQER
jgi:hypothetical protein